MCFSFHTYPLRDTIPLGTITATQTFVFKKPFGTIIRNAYVQGSATFAANDSNYTAVGAINKGTAGAGTGVIINVATAANTSKATGGTGYAAYVPNSTLVLTAASINHVAANESVEFTVAITGTVSIAGFYLFIDYDNPVKS